MDASEPLPYVRFSTLFSVCWPQAANGKACRKSYRSRARRIPTSCFGIRAEHLSAFTRRFTPPFGSRRSEWRASRRGSQSAKAAQQDARRSTRKAIMRARKLSAASVTSPLTRPVSFLAWAFARRHSGLRRRRPAVAKRAAALFHYRENLRRLRLSETDNDADRHHTRTLENADRQMFIHSRLCLYSTSS